MVWTGTAFRPPPRHDVEAWNLAERLIAEGFRFRSTRERATVPKTRASLERWQAARASAPEWLEERTISLERDAGGKLEVRFGRRVLEDREEVLVWNRAWQRGTLRLRGDGGKPLMRPLVITADGARVFLTPRTRARVRARR